MQRLPRRLAHAVKNSSRLEVAVAAAFLGCAVGIGAASLLGTSPADANRARAIPRLPAPTARIARQVLRDEVRVPCEPRSEVTSVMPPRVPAGSPRVVTAIGAKVGETVETGDHLATVSGVPLVAFVTRIPFYRDLGPGDRGPDVAALERALVVARKLRRADSLFDGRTAAALNAIYAAADAETPHLVDHLRLASSVSVPERTAVSEVDVTVGQVVAPNAPLMVLAGRGSMLSCRVPQSVAVSAGDRLRVGDASGQVLVRSVGEADRTSGQREMVVVHAGNAAAAEGLDLVIPLNVTTGAVLTVPVGAIWTAADGSFETRKVVDDKVTRVTVDVGTIAGGYAEISGDGLAAGDEVELHADLEGRAEPVPNGGSP